MSDDFEIDIQDTTETNEKPIQLPANILLFGEIEHDDVKVYIKQNVYKALEKYALADTEHERGTIILGDYCEELGKTHVIISDYIEAKFTDASASTLTFTHETWDYVNKQYDELYPDRKIVGWQHTHPNYGIFLSNYDLFIQENFFNMPFQIAYVIDPIQNLRGFFQWKNGKIEKLKGFYVYDDIGKPIKIEQSRKGTEKKPPQKSNVLFNSLLAIACICIVILSVITVNMKGQIKRQQEQQTKLNQTITAQDDSIKSIREELEKSSFKLEDGTTVEGLVNLIKEQQIKLENQQQVIDQLQDYVDGQDKDGENTLVVLKSYTIQSGDSLEAICNKFNIDYSSNINIIKSLNGIEDTNKIYAGQVLLLPIQKEK